MQKFIPGVSEAIKSIKIHVEHLITKFKRMYDVSVLYTKIKIVK